MMQQAQRQRPAGQQQQQRAPQHFGQTSSSDSRTSYSVMSESISDRRTLLGQSYYQDAKKFIGDALTADESGDRMSALELYNKSLSTIRSGLAVLESSVGASSLQNSPLLALKGKMEKMKEQIKSRMEELLQQELEARAALAKSTLGSRSSLSKSAAEVKAAATTSSGVNSTMSERHRASEEAKADVLFNMDRGIGLFEVDKKDHVRKYSDVDTISIFKFRHKRPGQPPAFLQCGGFIFPLVPGKSPILKSGGVYMFPELRSGEDGNRVGVSLESASKEQLAQLDGILSELADLRTTQEVKDQEVGVAKEEKGDANWGSTVAGGIDKGVNWMSTKIAQGTEVAGNLIIKGANKLRESIDPNEKPTEIPESVQTGVHYTRKATGYVVVVSDFLMTSLAKVTVKVGKGVRDAVAESEYVKGREVNPHAKEAWKVTKSGLKGAADVFSELKSGAGAVVRAMGKETSNTVGHKYGEDAGKVADDSLAAAGNTVSLAATYWSWKTWGITLLGKIGEVVSKDSKADPKTLPVAVH